MTLKVLFVEDVPLDVEMATVQLKRAGMQPVVRRVETEDDFIRELDEFKPDVILSDFSMPVFSAFVALELALQRSPNIPFIIVSGGIGEATAVDSLKRGATDYVLKSNLLRLPAAVERAIAEAGERRARHALENELRESEKRYRALFDSNPHPMWAYDIETLRFLAVNDTAVAHYGFSREEFLTMTIKHIRPETDLRRLQERMADPLPTENKPETWQHRKKRGELIDVEIASHDIVLEGRRARIVVAYDVTERKLAEQRLLQSEAKYRELIEHAPDGIYLTDREGHFLMANSRGCELLGYTEDELLRLNGRVTYLEEELEIRTERLKQIRAGQALRFERMVRRKDGSVFPAEISLKMLDADRTQAIFHDITTRRDQEHKIARLSRIQAVLSGINSAIVRIRDRQELFHEGCRIAVEHGGFSVGWIGVLDHASATLVPVAQAGLPIDLGADSDSSGRPGALVPRGTAEMALRHKSPAFDNDIEVDAGSLDGEIGADTLSVRRAAIRLGAKSVIVLPLLVDGQTFGILTLYAPERNFFDDEELKLLTELASDISFAMEYIEKDERLNYLAYYDGLTGLANRSLLQDRLSQALHYSERYGLQVAVLVVDLDRFKFVNDTLGHSAGDELLKLAAGRMTACVRDTDTAARIGGDEFVLVLAGADNDQDSVLHITRRILEAFSQPVMLENRELFVTCSIGVALYPRDGRDVETLVRNADSAMYRAKEQGRNNCQFYTPEASARAEERLSLEAKLRRALERGEFGLHYQPLVDLRTGQVIGLEALIRWQEAELGMVSPVRFIPVAEETALILPIGEWVLRTACVQNKAWQDQGLRRVSVAVNLSAQQFRQKDLARQIQGILSTTGLESKYLEVELTESMLMQNVEQAIHIMSELREMGVHISLDDFGTGYSSLSYLKRFPIDTVKVDKSFVREITVDADSAAIADAIIAMGHSLRLTVLAEGVETEEQLVYLRARGCNRMQGYLFSKPLPPDELAQLLRDGRRLPEQDLTELPVRSLVSGRKR
jgi:diguanylate cyclase (GGDEF)-like protein/PAS domain S-box-containing protein